MKVYATSGLSPVETLDEAVEQFLGECADGDLHETVTVHHYMKVSADDDDHILHAGTTTVDLNAWKHDEAIQNTPLPHSTNER